MVLVFPYLLDGVPGCVRKEAMEVRADLIRQAHAMTPKPEWFREVVKVLPAWWWKRIGRGAKLTPTGIRKRNGRRVFLDDLPEVLI